MNEVETRAEHINPALKAAGWGVAQGSLIRREYPITPGRKWFLILEAPISPATASSVPCG